MFLHQQSAIERNAAACGWRIIISPMILQGSPSCYDPAMHNLVVLFIHFIATLARLLGPGGVRSIVAESLLLATRCWRGILYGVRHIPEEKVSERRVCLCGTYWAMPNLERCTPSP
jgi:hypothetical protein